METRVENIESPEYAKIIVLRLVTDKGNSIRVDVPLRLLDEAGIRIEKDDLINIEIKRELVDMDSWDIVYSCKAYMEREGRTLISCGGLQVSLDSSLIDTRPGERVYIYIKKV
ncbi:MAG: hypothetical protein J7K23_00335 [Thermoproteales archaeon]|nr:hypothetical protein [Thermoproteales archaeon]